MSKISKLSRTLLLLLLLLFVGMNLFCAKRKVFAVGTEGARSQKRKIEKIFSQSSLDRNAKRIGFGYKTSNLIELKNIVENLSTQLPEGYHVAVPSFVGITSQQIQDFFKKNDLNIQVRWNEIKPSMDIDDQIEYLKDSENRKNFIESSEQLAEDIENLMLSADNLGLENITYFLNGATENNWRLMVRSTGKEDTKELPNAGGNHSEPNVYPDKVAVINAIKKVVASYFKEKSLSQRIDAGDKDIFADPLTPVLLQRMIGEKITLRRASRSAEASQDTQGERAIDEIPVGCVVYTGEVEGSTSGVITIQAAFGHNEGVVNSEVAVDTYYVKNQKIRPIIQIKNQRIIPVESDEEYGLKLVNNPDELKKIQVLSDEDILAIDVVARAVHDYYNEAMDIELLFEPSTKIIYLVQARPLQVLDVVTASYIADVRNISSENIVKCSTVSAAGGGVRRVTNKNQIITASTLQQALDKYLSGGIDQTQVAVVIVEGQAEPTSHAAAIFRGAGKAILTSDKIEKLEKWLDEENINLYVDAQREIVVNATDLMEADGFIKTGWFKHPISQRLSISGPAFFGPLQKADEKFKQKLYPELIKIMKENKKADAEKALNALMWKFNDLLYERYGEPQSELVKERLRLGQKAYNVATRLAQEILKDEVFKKAPQDILRLYFINFLEAILFQPKETSKYVNVFSVRSVFKEHEKMYEFINNKLSPMLGNKSSVITQNLSALHFTMIGCDELYTDEIQKKWIEFVYGVFNSNDTNKQNFINLLTEIEKMEVLPAWINISFSSQVLKAGSEIERLNNLVGEYDQVKDILDILKQKKEQLESYNISRWDEANKFQDNLKHFEKNFLNYYMSDNFFELFYAAKESQLAIIVLTSLMNKFVDTFDKSIKVLKSSTKYKSDTDKVKDFKAIIDKYLDLFESWTKIIPEGAIQFHLEWPLEKYRDKIREIFNKITSLDLQQLNPSSGFSVAAAALGSTTQLDRHFPRRVEDVFTVIHQSLLVINGVILKKYCDVSAINLNKLFQEIQRNFLQVSHDSRNSALISVYFLKDKIVFHYNLPLRNHSVFFDLSMNKNGTTSIKCNFIGQARERWEKILTIAFICSLLEPFGFSVDFCGPQVLIFTIIYKDYPLVVYTKDVIELLINYSFALDVRSLFDTLSKIYKSSHEEIIKKIYNSLYIDKKIIANPYLIEFSHLLIKSADKQAVDLGIRIVNGVFDGDNDELKKEALRRFGIVYELLRSETANNSEIAMGILNNVFEFGSDDLKIKTLKIYDFVSRLVTSDSSVKDGILTFLKHVFAGNDEKLKIKMLGKESYVSPFYFLITSKYKLFVDKVTAIIEDIFKNGSIELKKAALYSLTTLIKYSDSQNAISLITNILNNIFESDSDELKEASLQPFVKLFCHSCTNSEINLAEKFLNNVFIPGSEGLKKKFLRNEVVVIKLINSGDEKALNIAKSFFLDAIKNGSISLKEDLFKLYGPIYKLTKNGSDRVIEFVIDILQYIFFGSDDELKAVVLDSYYTIPDLINSENQEALNAVTIILSDIFNGDLEKLKEIALKNFAKYIKEKNIKTD